MAHKASENAKYTYLTNGGSRPFPARRVAEKLHLTYSRFVVSSGTS